MSLVTRQVIGTYNFTKGHPLIEPKLNVSIKEAYSDTRAYYVAVFDHIQKQFFIGLTTSFESYIYGIYRMMSCNRKLQIPKSLRNAFLKQEVDHWSVEVYAHESLQMESFQRKMRHAGWKELSATTSVQRNTSVNKTLYRYTDFESGWTHYTTLKDGVDLKNVAVNIRNAVAAIRYRGTLWGTNTTQREARDSYYQAIAAIKDRTYDRFAHKVESLFELPPEALMFTGIALTRYMNVQAAEQWVNSEYYKNIPKLFPPTQVRAYRR